MAKGKGIETLSVKENHLPETAKSLFTGNPNSSPVSSICPSLKERGTLDMTLSSGLRKQIELWRHVPSNGVRSLGSTARFFFIIMVDVFFGVDRQT